MYLSDVLNESVSASGGSDVEYILPFTSSDIHVINFDCEIDVKIFGAGGGGSIASHYGSQNNYPVNTQSGAWGCGRFKVKKGDVLNFVIGAVVSGSTNNIKARSGSTSLSINDVVVMNAEGGMCGYASNIALGSGYFPDDPLGKFTGGDYGFDSNALITNVVHGNASGIPIRLSSGTYKENQFSILKTVFGNSIGLFNQVNGSFGFYDYDLFATNSNSSTFSNVFCVGGSNNWSPNTKNPNFAGRGLAVMKVFRSK